MKTITMLEIDKIDLSLMVFAAKWQLIEWNRLTPNDLYKAEILKLENISNFMKDTKTTRYYLYTDIFQLR